MIPSGTAHIESSAEAASVLIEGGASVVIEPGAGLQVANSPRDVSVHNRGSLECRGTVRIVGQQGSGSPSLHNEGTLTNSGGVRIQASEWYAFHNEGDATNDGTMEFAANNTWNVFNDARFVNSGSILIHQALGDGLINRATGGFHNTGELRIEPHLNALMSYGRFDNEQGALLEIVANPSAGLGGIYVGASNTSAPSRFVNRGFVRVSEGRANVRVGGEARFDNRGKMYLARAHEAGIVVDGDGVFRNFAQVNNDQNHTLGIHIRTDGTLINRRYGNLWTRDNADTALYVEANGEVRNAGRFEIAESGGLGISNSGVIINRPRGRLGIEDRIRTYPNSTFTNAGHLVNEYIGWHIIDPGSLVNSGCIGDRHESLAVPLPDNAGVHVVQLPAPVTTGSPVANALDRGPAAGVTVDGWTTVSGSAQAGTYDDATNTFTPNSNGVGDTELRVTLTITSVSHQLAYRAPVPGGIQ